VLEDGEEEISGLGVICRIVQYPEYFHGISDKELRYETGREKQVPYCTGYTIHFNTQKHKPLVEPFGKAL